MANPMQERTDAPDSGQSAAPVRPTAATGQRPRQAALHRCPNCGAINRSHASICPECGESLRTKPRQIRCRQCGKRTSSVLVICPHCGRELVEAPARWALWGIPALLVLLFLILLASRWNSLQPVSWLGAQVNAGLDLIGELSATLDPNVTSESTLPPAEEGALAAEGEDAGGETTLVALVEEPPVDPPVEVVAADPVEEDAPAIADAPPPPPTDTPTQAPTATEAPPTATETSLPTATATELPTATDTPTAEPTATEPPATATSIATVAATTPTTSVLAFLLPTLTPTRRITPPTIAALTQPVRAANTRAATATATSPPTATDTPQPTPTDTLLPTATATETPQPTPTPIPLRTHRIQAGDTLSAIGARYGVSIDGIMAANNLTAQDVYRLRPGDELVIPNGGVAAGAAAPAAALPAPTTPPRTYTVQAGDTPIAIANRMGVTVDALLAANNLTLDDARRLRTGQVLVVPGNNQTSAAAPAAPANPVAPSNGQQAIRLEAPRLRSPENGAQVSCNSANSIAWLPVEFMRESDQFLLHLGFVSAIGADGRETITWVLEQVQGANNTLWAMDTGLCGLAPQQFGRKWYWYVEVIDTANATRVRVSAPSEVWTFSWN
ncbi:MAG: hypothetical protein DCC55_01695 [Chloroflexi bacterium]|nr:MAG: hypothetical protein DCC55_01695 [Chloroflexota bacterium]